MSGLEYIVEESYIDEHGVRHITRVRTLGVSVSVDPDMPDDEVPIVEPLTPMQQAAGLKPRVIARIVDVDIH